MTIYDLDIEDLEQRIRGCQKNIIVNREFLKEDDISEESYIKYKGEIDRLKKEILHYQRELSRKYKMNNMDKRFPENLEYTDKYF